MNAVLTTLTIAMTVGIIVVNASNGCIENCEEQGLSCCEGTLTCTPFYVCGGAEDGRKKRGWWDNSSDGDGGDKDADYDSDYSDDDDDDGRK